jgi:hypothetical protein
MKFKEIDEIKGKKFSNEYGTTAYIERYVHYEGSEQISIHIKNGFGADEKMINEVILEDHLSSFIEKFTNKKIKEVSITTTATIQETKKEVVVPSKVKKEINPVFIPPRIKKEAIVDRDKKKETKIIEIKSETEQVKPNQTEMNTEQESTENIVIENNHQYLRKVLFETMVGVKDGSIDVNKSKAISAVAQTIINSFKAENEANKKLK